MKQNVKRLICMITAVTLLLTATVFALAAEDTVLKGKTALFVGDSICWANRDNNVGWPGRIAEAYGMTNTNAGVSGSSLSTARPNRIVSQLKKYAGQQFDYVILHGGVNDAWDSYPVGKMSDSYELADFDTATYAGGLEELIYTAIDLYGDHAAIGYLMNFHQPKAPNGRISDMSEYYAEGKKICDKWGIPYFDMYNNQEINTALKNTTNEILEDYIHPNSAGYVILTPYIAEFMMTLKTFDGDFMWEDLYAKYAQAAADLSDEYFTPESYAAFQAAVAGVTEGTAREKYEALAAAGELLRQNDTPVPMSLFGENPFYQALKKLAIDTPADLNALAADSKTNTFAGYEFYVTGNLDMAGTAAFAMIGSAGAPFAGTFDGGNFTISNLKIQTPGVDSGMFMVTNGAVIKNFTLEKATAQFTAATNTVNDGNGFVAGKISGTLLENIHVVEGTLHTGTTTNARYNYGGLVGISTGAASTIRDCSFEKGFMDIDSQGMGGIIGWATNVELVRCCTINSTIDARRNSGCLIGYMAGNVTVRECFTYGNKLTCIYNGGRINTHGALAGQVNTGTNTLKDSVFCETDQAVVGYHNPAATLNASNHYAANTVVPDTDNTNENAATLAADKLKSGEIAWMFGWSMKDGNLAFDSETNQPAHRYTYKNGDEVLGVLYTDYAGNTIGTVQEPSSDDDLPFAGWSASADEKEGDQIFTALFGKKLPGDVNSDNTVDTADAVVLLQYLNHWDVTIDMTAADVNGDGLVSIFDVVRLLQIIAE